MILYYALTTYHIQCCVLHKLTQKKNEEAILLLSDIHQNSVAFLSRYKSSNIFSDVILLPEMEINAHVRKNEARHRSKMSILNTACKEIKSALPVNLQNFSDIYLCPDHFPFGWYILNNKIKYHCFEEGCGVLSDNKFMMSNMKRNKTQYQLMDVLGYFGSSDCAVEILADEKAQIEGYKNSKMTDFSVKRILQTLSPQELKTVLSFFGVTEKVAKSNEKLSLILTQHMANLGIMSLEEQHLIYKLFADYFLDKTHIIVKPHPDDIAGRYDEIFCGNATALPFAMPSELLPYCMDDKLEIAIAAYSTAVKNLGDFCNRMICFDQRIMTDFRHIHRYYAVLKALQFTNSLNSPIVTNGDELLFDELAQNESLKPNIKNSAELTDIQGVAVISDELSETRTIDNICSYLLSLKNDEIIIFLNENNKHIYFDGIHTEVFKNIRPIFISIKENNKITEEVIYVYSTNADVIEKVENFNLTKELKYTGVTLDIHSISHSDSEKIKMLEGVLDATEKRLKEYINNKKKLDEQIEKLSKNK